MSVQVVGILRSLANQCGRLFGRISTREVLCAAAGLKPVRVSVPESEVQGAVYVLESHGLQVEVGVVSHWLARDVGKGGWSSTSDEPGRGESWKHLYVAQDAVGASRLREAEESGNDEEFGRCLLIPACCRHMFLTRCREAQAAQYDFFRFSYPQATNLSPWISNVASQYFDASFLSHYPCSPSCTDSLKLAGIVRRILHSVTPEVAREVESMMMSACVYTELQGVFLLPGFRFHGEWVESIQKRYSTCVSGDVYALISAASKIRCPRVGQIEALVGNEIRSVSAEGARIVIPFREENVR